MATIHQFMPKTETEAATLRCTSCGKTTEAACSCGVGYEYIAPGKLAEQAVKDNPDLSNVAIAEKLGIDESTVRKARKSTSGNPEVGKRTGKDGKTRRMPRKKAEQPKERVGRRGQSMPQLERARAIVRPLMEAGKPFQCHALEAQNPDISHYTFDAAIAAEKGHREAQAELLDAAAAKHFSDKGALRLEDAIRIHKARLDKQFEQRVNEEVRRRIDAANDSTRESNKRLHLENINLQRIVGQRGVFTETQFKQMLMLCHPDNSAGPELKAALLQVLVENKIKLIKSEK